MKKNLLIFIDMLLIGVVAVFVTRKLLPQQNVTDEDILNTNSDDCTQENINDKVIAEEVNGVYILTENAFSEEDVCDDGTVVISLSKALSIPYEIDVPSTFQGKKVSCFMGVTNDSYVEKIAFPDNVSFIQIDSCKNLREIVLGKLTTPELTEEEIDIVTVPYYGTISNCENLEKIVVPEPEGSGVGLTGWNQLPKLENLVLPEKTLALGYIDFHNVEEMKLPEKCLALICAFSGTEGLKKVECDEKLQSIEGSFWYMQELEEVVIPSVETEITNSFKECPNLTLVVQEGSLAEEYARENGIAYRYITED